LLLLLPLVGGWNDAQITDSINHPRPDARVDALCTVTGQAAPAVYAVSLNTNGVPLRRAPSPLHLGVGASLPVHVTRAKLGLHRLVRRPAFTGGPVTSIGAAETGDKAFWAKWNYDISGVVEDGGGALPGASVNIRGNNVSPPDHRLRFKRQLTLL
jgi:hypothetical protein